MIPVFNQHRERCIRLRDALKGHIDELRGREAGDNEVLRVAIAVSPLMESLPTKEELALLVATQADEIEALTTALKWYGDDQNYLVEGWQSGRPSLVALDHGDRARQTLNILDPEG